MFSFFTRWKNRRKKAFRIFTTEKETFDSLPLNQAVQVMADEVSICVIRTHSGIHALEDRCPHQDAPIHRGKCKADGTITCPYHGMNISLSNGKLQEERIGKPSKIYPVELSKNGLIVWV